MSVSFSGLASGLDTKSLVSSLVQVARAPETSVLSSQSNLRTQKDILTDLESKLSDLATAAHRFDLGADAQSMTASLSDASHVSVAVSGGAAPAVHAIRVLDTAQAQVVTSRTFSTSAAGVL